MKKTEKRKVIFSIAILVACLSIYKPVSAQYVGHAYGSYCVGSMNVFYYAGPGGAVAWYTDGTIISNNGSSIQVVWNNATSSGYVNCTYNSGSGYGSTSLYPIVINLSATPSVSIAASTNNTCSGTAVTFTASPVNGGSSPSYSWYIDGNFISSSSSNTFSSSSLTNGQQVYCVMYSNASCVSPNSVSSNVITVNVSSPLQLGITISGNTTICQGSQGSFVASVTNVTGPINYQWQKNGVNVTSDGYGVPAYALLLNSVSTNDVITCIATPSGCPNSVTSNLLTLSVVTPQTFTVYPSPAQISLCQDAQVTFTAASSFSTYNYQWYLNGSPVSGATNSTFTTTATTVAQLQSVSVTASTNSGCVNNTTASGSAQYIPFSIQPWVTPTASIIEPSVVLLGSPATFTVNTNSSYPTFQWQLNGIDVAGATGTTFSPTISSGDQYQKIGVVVTSHDVCVVSPITTTNWVEIASANWENLNYVRVHDMVASGKTNWVQVDGLAIGDKSQSTTYLDGTARSIQIVGKQASQLESGGWADMVVHIEYDAAGRVEKSFLPYASSTAIGQFKSSAQSEQASFIRNKYGEDANAPTYAKLGFEQNPLSRVLTVKAPGTAFGGDNVNYAGVSTQYEFNAATEGVRIWKIDPTLNATPSSTATFSEGTLIKTVTVDEKLKKIYTYTDFEGKTILKRVQIDDLAADNSHDGWLCTYYVYDELGQLRSIITPKAVKYLQSNSWSFLSNDVYQELCYYYDFDERGRMIVKHSAGAGQIQMVYDNKDRLVLSQDENQRNRSSKQWSYFLYDGLNRVVVDGLFDNSASRTGMADYVKNNLNNGIVSLGINAGGMEGIFVDNPVAGNTTYCNNCSNMVVNNIHYYDNYNFRSTRPFITDYSFASSADPYVESTVQSKRVLNFATATRSRVIDQNYNDNNVNNDLYIFSMLFYDEKGRPLQDIYYNIKGGQDYVTMQYNFSGRLLSVCDHHSFPGSDMSDYVVISKHEYNNIGQLTRISKKYGTQNYKKLVEYSYDEYGRLKNTKLSPDYNSGSGMENLKYDYNIHGWLTGINKDYALSNSVLNQWDHFFGAYFGYDNRDNLFTAKQYNGNITGTIWKTQGDNMPRKYDYQYDNAGRFKTANFLQKEKATDATWSNTKMDFSMTNISYDESGNLLQMYRKGIIPGNNNPLFIDKLAYEYKQVGGSQWSNQLRRIFDQTSDLTAVTNGTLGDFKDDAFGINDDDYSFDGNGNLIKDNNKKIRIGSAAGVEYNFMNKPQKVTLENKSVIEFIYDATGEKIAKKVTYTQGGASRTTWYNGNYIYEESNSVIQLKTILHEEGRIRVFQPVSNPRLTLGGNFALPGTNNKGVFEFFIKDNLRNVRMILTEETRSEYNNCTMETAGSSYEERMFGQVDANNNPVIGSNEVMLTRKDKTTYAPGWTSNSSTSVSRLKQDEQKLGPNMILKVMAGDVINAQSNYYYTGSVDNTGSSGVLNSILTNLLTTLTNSAPAGPLKGSASNITTNYNQTPGALGSFLAGQNNGSSTPQAYLNILFFDENFNFVSYDNVTGLGSYGWRVGGAGDGQSPIIAPNVKVPKNGYAFIYLSNESKTPVYFDDLAVTHTRGRIVEEDAYYPFGLKIAAISSKAFDVAANPYQYQGEYSERDDETAWNEFDLRNYDAQTGRFTGVDPNDQFASPYMGMGNDPVNLIDPTGGISIDFGTIGSITGSVLADRALITLGGAAIGYGIDKLTGGKGWTGAAIGGGVALTATFIPPFDISVITDWTRDWLPGLIAAPVSGTIDIIGSVVGIAGSIVKGDKTATNTHLENVGKGLLETMGLKEGLTEKWRPGATGGRLPNSLADIVEDVNKKVWSGYVDAPQKNGMHAWHAGTNAALTQRLGPVGAIFVFLGGIYHETPLDKGSFKAEQAAQGTINHILDSFSDIISNGVGMTIGLILPKRAARNVAIKVGNQIPGPGDPDPHGLGTGGYTGNPLDAWGQYPKFK